MKKTMLLLLLLLSSTIYAANTLPTPPNLAALDSTPGITSFNQATNKKDFWPLSRYFITQRNQAFCGVASLVMVLNALDVSAPFSATYYPYKSFTQKNIFTKTVITHFTPDQITRHGLTLDQLNELANLFPLKVHSYHATNDDNFKQFKTQTIAALDSGNTFVIVNFNRKSIGEVGSGHFSPLAAYDQNTDSFLLMDVSRYKYPPVWVSTKTLWQAMHTIDSTSKKYRGYLVLKSA